MKRRAKLLHNYSVSVGVARMLLATRELESDLDMPDDLKTDPAETEKKHKKPKHPHPTATPPPTTTPPAPTTTPPPTPTGSGQPVFSQPIPSPDPSGFKNPVTDQGIYGIGQVSSVPLPASGAVEPVLTLEAVYGSAGAAKVSAIEAAGQIVFHSVGDTGNVNGPETIGLVADKMVSDFEEDDAADVPSFFFHLGDAVYYFGEATYYYDQFYDPYRNYPAPILAVPGNHDGNVYAKEAATSLEAFLDNFVTPTALPSPDAGGLYRTTMIQPAVYFTFEAPFVRILGLYSNVLEDPGVISGQNGTYSNLDNRQIEFLTAALTRVKTENFTGAVIVTVHHPPYTGGSTHGGSPLMLADIDSACTTAGVWPHAIFSGHAHNYQRFTRTVNDFDVAYIVAGCGGYSPLSTMSGTYRTPFQIDSDLTLESYDDTDFGYLRVIVNATTLTVEFHPQGDGSVTKTPDDVVTIDLATHMVK